MSKEKMLNRVEEQMKKMMSSPSIEIPLLIQYVKELEAQISEEKCNQIARTVVEKEAERDGRSNDGLRSGDELRDMIHHDILGKLLSHCDYVEKEWNHVAFKYRDLKEDIQEVFEEWEEPNTEEMLKEIKDIVYTDDAE